MAMLEYKLVKRCGRCYHLYNESLERCPYCMGDAIARPSAVTSHKESKSSIKFSMPKVKLPKIKLPKVTFTAKTKHRILVGLLSLVGVAILCVAGYFLYGYIASSRILDKSIMKPLSAKELNRKAESVPNLRDYYSLICVIRSKVIGTPSAKLYESISYAEMIDFLKVYTNTNEINKILLSGETTYSNSLKDYDEQFDQLVDKWQESYNLYSPSNYLKLTFHTKYTDVNGSLSSTAYPGFWVEISYPRGDVVACSVFLGLWNTNTEVWHPNAQTNASLSDLKDMIEENNYHWSNIRDTDRSTYDEWQMKYVVQSVELADGTTYSVDKLSDIPSELLDYFEVPTKHNKNLAIQALIDSNFQDKDSYISSYLDKSLSALSPLCYQLIEEVNSVEEVIPMGGF